MTLHNQYFWMNRRVTALKPTGHHKHIASRHVAQTQCVSRSDKFIPRLIKTDVFCFSPRIDKGVNKNPNNFITNKPILKIKKTIWRAESILLATLNTQKSTVPEKEDKPLF